MVFRLFSCWLVAGGNEKKWEGGNAKTLKKRGKEGENVTRVARGTIIITMGRTKLPSREFSHYHQKYWKKRSSSQMLQTRQEREREREYISSMSRHCSELPTFLSEFFLSFFLSFLSTLFNCETIAEGTIITMGRGAKACQNWPFFCIFCNFCKICKNWPLKVFSLLLWK